MSDAGEGLIDAESRIQERMEELEQEKRASATPARQGRDPEQLRAFESLRLARTELERQFATTTHEWRRTQLRQAIAEVDRRMKDLGGLVP
jgi:hypothetical protein